MSEQALHVQIQVAERGLDVDFAVNTGETLALLGPNGAGKSTTLDVVAGLLRPDAGRVALNGRELTSDRVWLSPPKRKIALLAQEPLLFPHLSVRHNVEFGPRSLGMPRRAAQRLAEERLEQVSAIELAERKPSELSGGQAQRVAIARALAADPEVLLLDEPMAALDVAVKPALRSTLRRVLRDQTCLLVTHDPLDALLLADRVAVIEHGKLVELGPTDHVLARPRSGFAAKIAGLNMVTGHWRADAVQAGDLRVAGMPAEHPLVQGEPAIAVFRPASVSVFTSPPGGSPRVTMALRVTEIEPHGDQVRVRAGELAADITARSAAELDLDIGTPVVFSVKATEVAVYPRDPAHRSPESGAAG